MLQGYRLQVYRLQVILVEERLNFLNLSLVVLAE